MLEVEHLSVSYGAAAALHDVTLQIGDGAIVSVIGSNGAGKTTLLRAISGNLARHNASRTFGQIKFNGTELAGKSPRESVQRGLIQVPEGRRIFTRLTVEENLKVGLMGGKTSESKREHWDEVVDLFPILRDRLTQRAGLMSGGEQQMLAIARALMADPTLLLLDEPSLGLAPRIVGRVGELIREINSRGVAVLLVEQNAALALNVATTALVLSNGRVSLSGNTSELRESDEVRRLILGDTMEVDDASA